MFEHIVPSGVQHFSESSKGMEAFKDGCTCGFGCLSEMEEGGMVQMIWEVQKARERF